MPRRILVAVNSRLADVNLRNAITKLLEAKGWEVWHWFEDIWLLADVPDTQKLEILRDEIRSLSKKNMHVLVMNVDGNGLAGRIPTAGAPWLEEFWRKKEKPETE